MAINLSISGDQLKPHSSIVAEEKKTIKLMGSRRKVPGHIMFEYNPSTKELKPALYDEVRFEVLPHRNRSAETIKRYKLLTNENCIYLQALNTKNAVKKLLKAGVYES